VLVCDVVLGIDRSGPHRPPSIKYRLSAEAQLVVDEVSLSFLEECEIDYVEEMIRSSFQVVKNKLADSKCGCGSSFSVNNF